MIIPDLQAFISQLAALRADLAVIEFRDKTFTHQFDMSVDNVDYGEITLYLTTSLGLISAASEFPATAVEILRGELAKLVNG